VHAIKLALGRDPRVVLWDNRVWSQGRSIPGLGPGSSDLIGIVRPDGRMIALEVKTTRGTTSDEQDLFLALVRDMGGHSAVVRSVEDAVREVGAAIG
jgi:hypothetical protein